MAARLLLREPFTRSPLAFVRFDVEALPSGDSEVRASGWVDDGRSPRRSVALEGGRFAREMRDFLESL
jgi:hypothetical protein